MYAVVLHIFYQLAKYEKDPMKNGREIIDIGKEIKEKRKDNTTIERSSDLSADLKNFMNTYQVMIIKLLYEIDDLSSS